MARNRRLAITELACWVLFADPAERAHTSRFPAVIVVVLVTLVNATCQWRGLYESWEWVDLDKMQAASVDLKPTDMSVVLIGNEEYEDPQLFGGVSPLEPKILTRIIDAVCGFAPRVVAIDLLTEQWSTADRDRLQPARDSGCRMIWAHDSIEVDSSDDENALAAQELGRVLGVEATPAWTCSALPILVADRDAVVRRYVDAFPIRTAGAASGVRFEPTLPASLHAAWTGQREWCLGQHDGPAHVTKLEKIRFTHTRGIHKLAARYVLEAARSESEFRALAERTLKGKAVILGAAYRHARDIHPTPVGGLTGAEVVANATVTVANPIRDVNEILSVAIDLSIGVGLFFLVDAIRLRWAWAILASAIAAGLAAFAISWVLFNYVGYFLGVFASLAGVVLGTVTDLTWEHLLASWRGWRRKLSEKVEELRHAHEMASKEAGDGTNAAENAKGS